ncbi:hypothetical protein PSTT_09649 [Puccinia striiformis]|uniref:Uncharacterized protein n=1 Tax=Puccinia striiformis TaxID=27350 RepID=A0A2S4V7Q5_9BASI|nr:hypothetical protein PSTT_09649 [Puccinia striiformis]
MRCEGFCAGFHTLSSTSQRFPVRLRQKRDPFFQMFQNTEKTSLKRRWLGQEVRRSRLHQ